MGRFDALTTLDKKSAQTAPPPVIDAAKQQKPVPPSENENTSLLANQQTSKEANQQISLPTNLQTSKEVRKQTSLPVNQQTSKLLKKFGSYLTEESLKGLKRIAFESDRKDYEVLQEAVDQYLTKVKQKA